MYMCECVCGGSDGAWESEEVKCRIGRINIELGR